MNRLTLDVETLAVDSFDTGLADQDCPTASAGGATGTEARPCPV
jgi:hypothetical protein